MAAWFSYLLSAFPGVDIGRRVQPKRLDRPLTRILGPLTLGRLDTRRRTAAMQLAPAVAGMDGAPPGLPAALAAVPGAGAAVGDRHGRLLFGPPSWTVRGEQSRQSIEFGYWTEDRDVVGAVETFLVRLIEASEDLDSAADAMDPEMARVEFDGQAMARGARS